MFAAYVGETEQFTVATLDDTLLEGTEIFTVSLNASDPGVTDSDTGTGTIDDNDAAAVTVDDVTEAYMEGWRLGLKALAVYRDGSKRTQPLNASKEVAEVVELPQAQPV